jgi:transcriptional regulator with PAS, ATPase and Fis domain
MPLPMQGKILKAIENKRYRRLGGDRDIDISVRIIAATNRNLKEMVDNDLFRADLYYRLNVMTINIPPLRERKTDIPHLGQYFIELFNKEYDRNIEGISPAALELMQAYSWPGNVRELRNAIERALILEDSNMLSAGNLNLAAGPKKNSCPAVISTSRTDDNGDCSSTDNDLIFKTTPENSGELHITLPSDGISLEELEKRIIQLALEKHAGNQTKAARYLKLSRDTLRYRMKKFSL